jgi:hypothetical protein
MATRARLLITSPDREDLEPSEAPRTPWWLRPASSQQVREPTLALEGEVEVEEIVVGEPGSVGGELGVWWEQRSGLGDRDTTRGQQLGDAFVGRLGDDVRAVGTTEPVLAAIRDQAVGGPYDVQDDIIGSQIDLAT